MLLLYLHNSVYWFRLSDLKFFSAFGLLLSITGLLLLGSFSTLSTYLIRHLLIMQTRGPDCFFPRVIYYKKRKRTEEERSFEGNTFQMQTRSVPAPGCIQIPLMKKCHRKSNHQGLNLNKTSMVFKSSFHYYNSIANLTLWKVRICR